MKLERQDTMVSILGTKYTVVDDDSIKSMGYDGYCDLFKKVIKTRPACCMLADDSDEDDREEHWKEVMRHEVVHAYFNEAGIAKWCDDEDLVNWIAAMMPRIVRTAIELKAI